MGSQTENHNIIPFAKIEKTCERMGFGTLDVTFQIHQKQIVAIEGRQSQKIKFKEGRNSEAVAVLLAEIKSLHDTKQSGVFTYSIEFDKGDIKEVFFNRNLKESFELMAESG